MLTLLWEYPVLLVQCSSHAYRNALFTKRCHLKTDSPLALGGVEERVHGVEFYHFLQNSHQNPIVRQQRVFQVVFILLGDLPGQIHDSEHFYFLIFAFKIACIGLD